MGSPAMLIMMLVKSLLYQIPTHKQSAKNAPNCQGVQQADKYNFYFEHFDPCDLWYQDISFDETMLGCLPDDDRELIVHVFFCPIENPIYTLFGTIQGT